LDVANQKTILKETEFAELRTAIHRLQLIGTLQATLNEVRDCSDQFCEWLFFVCFFCSLLLFVVLYRSYDFFCGLL